jgi:hypothetical protein
MKSIFWLVAIILCLTVNESLVSWVLAVFVGSYNLMDGFDHAFSFFTLEGYLFYLAFRIIPFAVLLVVSHLYKNRLKGYLSVLGWFWLIGTVFYIAYGYWDAQYSLYTDVKTSSTTAISLMLIPIWAIPIGILSSMFGMAFAVIQSKIRERT